MPSTDDVADVLVIGGGASGAALTWRLSEAGINVGCLEQGGWVDSSTYATKDLDYEIHRQTAGTPTPITGGFPKTTALTTKNRTSSL